MEKTTPERENALPKTDDHMNDTVECAQKRVQQLEPLDQSAPMHYHLW